MCQAMRQSKWIMGLLIVIFLIGLASEICFSNRLSYSGLERNYIQLVQNKPKYFTIYGKLNYMRDYYYVDEDKLGIDRGE